MVCSSATGVHTGMQEYTPRSDRLTGVHVADSEDAIYLHFGLTTSIRH